MEHINFMKLALKEAKKAALIDEVPVGCVIVKDGKVIAKAHNQKEKYNNTILHAEIVALQKAYKKLGSWRLIDCDMYITLEPCIMCSGAIIHSRIRKVYFGTKDPKGGAICSIDNVFDNKFVNHKVSYEEGLLKDECSNILKEYFKAKRDKK